MDHYFLEGQRDAVFLGEKVTKYHRTLTSYLNGLLRNGFAITALVEPMPEEKLLDMPGMKDELRSANDAAGRGQKAVKQTCAISIKSMIS